MSNKSNKKINFKDRLTDDYLDLSLCDLENIPIKEIAELTKVRRLNLSYNRFTHLPEDFIKLQNIRELDLSKNKLKSLPKNFGALSNLKNLDLLGNELTDLPSSFLELKSLQWLDLKDNPLNTALKQAAGDCLDDKQCKKCALNVMNYVRTKAAEEDRQRQVEAKRKKELQLKKEAEEREKANQLKLQKKQEREQKRLANEQKRKQEEAMHTSEEESLIPNDFKSNSNKSYKNKSGVWSSFLSGVILGLVLMIMLLTTYILATSYCRLPARSTLELRRNIYVRPVLELIDDKICPYTDKNSEFFNYVIKTFNQ